MKITANDFFGAFFCALRLDSGAVQYECGERFNEAVQSAFDKFRELCTKEGFIPTFRILLDPLHGDSGTIESGLLSGIRSDFIGLENPDFVKFRLKVTPDEAKELLEILPGKPDIYRAVVKEFLAEYNRETTRV